MVNLITGISPENQQLESLELKNLTLDTRLAELELVITEKDQDLKDKTDLIHAQERTIKTMNEVIKNKFIIILNQSLRNWKHSKKVTSLVHHNELRHHLKGSPIQMVTIIKNI